MPLTAHVDDAQIRRYYIGPYQTIGWMTPEGEPVLLPRADSLPALISEFFAGASTNRLERPLTQVEVANGAPESVAEVLAVETLHNEGCVVTLAGPPDRPYDTTTIIDYTTSAKGSALKRRQSALHVSGDDVIAQPDAASPVQFRIILGAD